MPSAVKEKPLPARRNSQYNKKLSSILKAASEIIARHGFEGASIRQVAAKAGIGLSGIYYYFKSKDELLFAIQENTFSTLAESLEKRLEAVSTARERLKAVLDNHFHFFLNNMDDLKVCVHEIESLSGKYYKDILKIRRKYFGLVRNIVAENISSPAEFNDDLVSLYLFGSLNWIYMWYDPRRNPDMGVLSDQLLEIFLHGIKAT